MMTHTGTVAAAWLLAATQTNIYDILMTDPANRSDEQTAAIQGLAELDTYFQKNQAAIVGAAKVMASAGGTFKQMLADGGYTGTQCPGAGQLVALGEQGV